MVCIIITVTTVAKLVLRKEDIAFPSKFLNYLWEGTSVKTLPDSCSY